MSIWHYDIGTCDVEIALGTCKYHFCDKSTPRYLYSTLTVVNFEIDNNLMTVFYLVLELAFLPKTIVSWLSVNTTIIY